MKTDPLGLDPPALDAVMGTRWNSPDMAAIAFIYAVWDISYHKQEVSCAIAPINGTDANGKQVIKGWLINGFTYGGPDIVPITGGGLYNVHTHPYDAGEKYVDSDGKTQSAAPPFQASKLRQDVDDPGGDIGLAKLRRQSLFIGTPEGIGYWDLAKGDPSGKLKYVFPSPNQFQKLLSVTAQAFGYNYSRLHKRCWHCM